MKTSNKDYIDMPISTGSRPSQKAKGVRAPVKTTPDKKQTRTPMQPEILLQNIQQP